MHANGSHLWSLFFLVTHFLFYPTCFGLIVPCSSKKKKKVYKIICTMAQNSVKSFKNVGKSVFTAPAFVKWKWCKGEIRKIE